MGRPKFVLNARLLVDRTRMHVLLRSTHGITRKRYFMGFGLCKFLLKPFPVKNDREWHTDTPHTNVVRRQVRRRHVPRLSSSLYKYIILYYITLYIYYTSTVCLTVRLFNINFHTRIHFTLPFNFVFLFYLRTFDPIP